MSGNERVDGSWNIILADGRDVDIVTAGGNCYDSLSESYYNLYDKPGMKDKVNEQLARVGMHYKGTSKVSLLVNYLFNEIGLDVIKQAKTIISTA